MKHLADVVAAFDPHLAGLLGALLAAESDKVVAGDGLGPNKTPLEVAVDFRSGFRRRRRFLGSLDLHTAHSQPIMGTPLDVPHPRTVIIML